jgi:shikimate kinase
MNSVPHMVITGLMASGKTSVARVLADLLGCSMIDLDEVISEREQRSIREIIEQEGETYFRQRETSALAHVLRSERACVIALGGGAWIRQRNRRLIARRHCLTVWLDAPFELCWQRITQAGNNERPFARAQDQARRLYQERLPLYGTAAIRIGANGRKSVKELAGEIVARCHRNNSSPILQSPRGIRK